MTFLQVLSSLEDNAVEQIEKVASSPMGFVVVALISAAATVITLVIKELFSTHRDNKKNKSVAIETQKDLHVAIVQADLDEIAKQREFLSKENKELWETLKNELISSKQIIQSLEDEIVRNREEMSEVIKINRDEIEKLNLKIDELKVELHSWTTGLKTLPGYVLTKVQDPPDPDSF